ncbi:MAG TPA: biotin/lipoyl-containing protein, partial [Microbacterium sp.]|nr:biotin/lipoyl-containing protein [Microbacterium sp.]
MSTQTFVLPDVGEGLTEAEIVQWRVGPGDSVAVNDVLVEIETAKSLVELPSPFAGTVGDLLAAEGETVNVGAAIITIASETDAAPPATVGQSEHGEPAEAAGEGAVLVGYGTGGHVQSRRRKPAVPAEERVAASVGVIAKPPIRKLARDLGVELSAVAPTG